MNIFFVPVFMNYFDNPGGMIPTWLVNWAAKVSVFTFFALHICFFIAYILIYRSSTSMKRLKLYIKNYTLSFDNTLIHEVALGDHSYRCREIFPHLHRVSLLHVLV